MSSINQFTYDLRVAPSGSIRFLYIDALSLLRNPEKLSRILKKIDPNNGSGIDIRNFGKVPLTADQILWSYIALTVIGEYQNLLIDEAKEAKGTADELFKSASVSGFADLAVVLSGNAAWRELINLVAVRSPRLGDWSDATTQVMRDSLGKSPELASRVDVSGVKDFTTDVLTAFPENRLSPNFEFMRRRFIDTACGPAKAEIVSSKSTSPKMVMLCKTASCATLSGQASFTLLGFNDAIVGSEDVGESRTLSVTQEALFDAELNLSSKGVKFTSRILKPSLAQRKAILEEATTSALDVIEKGDISEVSAAEMLQMMDASADILLNDPNSPYSGKGYTRKDIHAIVLKSMFGSEGVSEIAQTIQKGLQSCIEQSRSLSAMIAVVDSEPFKSGDSVETLRVARDSVIEDYNNLLSYASILFDVQAPEESALRANGEPVSTATMIGYFVVASMVTAMIYGIYQIIEVRKEKTCDKLLGAEKSAHESAKTMVQSVLKDTTKLAELEAVVDILKDGVIKVDSGAEILRENDCTAAFVKGFDCLRAPLKTFASKTTYDDKKAVLNIIAKCLGAEGVRIEKDKKAAEARIEKLEKENPLTSWMNFVSTLFNQTASVFTYALYAALSVGVVWGGVKVYKAFKSDDA